MGHKLNAPLDYGACALDKDGLYSYLSTDTGVEPRFAEL